MSASPGGTYLGGYRLLQTYSWDETELLLHLLLGVKVTVLCLHQQAVVEF